MLELALYIGLPLSFAILAMHCRLEQAWIFFWSSLLAGYTAFGMLPFSTRKIASFLPETDRIWVPLLALPGVGVVLLILFAVFFSFWFPADSGKIRYLEKPASILRFLLVFSGSLIMMGLITLSLASLSQLDKWPLVSQRESLKFAQLVIPGTIQCAQCGTPMNPQQAVWQNQYPKFLYISSGGIGEKAEALAATAPSTAEQSAPDARSLPKTSLGDLKDFLSSLEK